MNSLADFDAKTIAAGIRAREFTAREIAGACLDRIAERDGDLNCFTTVTHDRALATADGIDAAIATGRDPGPLAGVPYAVKNLFDIAGYATCAGSKIHKDAVPALADAGLLQRMNDAGAVLVGALNMDEYAYGFTTENAHFGATRNPHDMTRVSGGSSGGSAAAVAGGLVPLSLGSDTNGSIRVPAAFCGVFGLKPTFGRLSRAGVFAFVNSLDHTGAFARSAADLAAAYDILQGIDPPDRAQANRPYEATQSGLRDGTDGLRIGVLDGWFRAGATADALEAVDRVSGFLGATPVTISGADVARAAAFCISAAEGANNHLSDLRKRPQDFDPATRDRLLAGALVPAAVILQAQRFRSWFRDRVAEIFTRYDVLIAPATPFSAPLIGEETVMIGDQRVLARANIGIYTQPISFIGLPVLTAPIHRPGKMPLGVQIIAAPWAEAVTFKVAAALEDAGIACAPIAGVQA
ncbi:MAG: amidase [Rhodospirillales bacterium]|nr:amidase [Rhodospirillales bacterium]